MDNLQPKLYPFQEAGVRFLKDHKNALLGDDVGLGKTVQVLKALEGETGPVLVICRTTSKDMWAHMIRKWLPSVDPRDILVCGAAGRHDMEELGAMFGPESFGPWEDPGPKNGPRRLTFAITHHESLLKIGKELRGLGVWTAVIVDESHHFRNYRAQRTKWLFKINSLRKYALTATPIEKSVADLWSMLHWFAPAKFSAYWPFFMEYVDYVDADYGGRKILGTRPEKVHQLGEITKHYMIRRVKKDVAVDLPPVRYEDVPIRLTEQAADLYEKLRHDVFIELSTMDQTSELFIGSALQRLSILQKFTSNPALLDFPLESAKLEWLKEFAEDLPASQQFIVVVRFRKTAEIIVGSLQGGCAVLGGDPEADIRVTEFQQGKHRFIVGTYMKIGESLNLQNASLLVLYDHWWSHTATAQAIGRVDRLGQTVSPIVMRLEVPGSIDTDILENIARKEGEHELVAKFLASVDR